MKTSSRVGFKTYCLYGYEIIRRNHIGDPHRHYTYQINLDGSISDCNTLNEAKEAIRKHLRLKKMTYGQH